MITFTIDKFINNDTFLSIMVEIKISKNMNMIFTCDICNNEYTTDQIKFKCNKDNRTEELCSCGYCNEDFFVCKSCVKKMEKDMMQNEKIVRKIHSNKLIKLENGNYVNPNNMKIEYNLFGNIVKIPISELKRKKKWK